MNQKLLLITIMLIFTLAGCGSEPEDSKLTYLKNDPFVSLEVSGATVEDYYENPYDDGEDDFIMPSRSAAEISYKYKFSSNKEAINGYKMMKQFAESNGWGDKQEVREQSYDEKPVYRPMQTSAKYEKEYAQYHEGRLSIRMNDSQKEVKVYLHMW